MTTKGEEYLAHIGVMGMHWGSKKGSKRDALNSKLKSTMAKSEKTKQKVAKLTTKLEKHGGYLTTIGYTMAKTTGRKLAKTLHRDKKLTKKIDRIKRKLDNLKVTDISREKINSGKNTVTSMLKAK